MDRTWSHQGVPPVDCQYLTLSTGALIPREGETGHFEGYRPASKHMGKCGGDQKENRTWLLAVSTKYGFYICLAAFNFPFVGEMLIFSHPFKLGLVLFVLFSAAE